MLPSKATRRDQSKPRTTLLTTLCRWWGARVSHGWGSVLSAFAGLIVAATLIAGVYRAELATSVSDQWALRGSRLLRDRARYEEFFDSLPRSLSVAISPDTAVSGSDKPADSALTRTSFRALLDASQKLYNVPDSKDAGVTSGEPYFAALDTICERAAVPTVLKPTSSRGAGIDGTVFSWGYGALSRCLAGKDALPEGVEPLDFGWGISAFPCSRTSALDCTGDGDFDYPEELQLIDRGGVARALLSATTEQGTEYQECIQELEDNYFLLTRFSFPDVEEARSQAQLLISALTESIVPMLASWGYSYRKRISEFESDEELRAYVAEALTNSQDESVTVEDCAFEGKPCCRLWNGVGLDISSFAGDLTTSGRGGAAKVTDAAVVSFSVVTRGAESDDLGNALADTVGGEGGRTLRDSVDERETVVLDFEGNFIQFFEQWRQKEPGTGFDTSEDFDGLRLDMFATRSGDDILRDGNRAPYSLIGIGYGIMALYTALALFVFSRPFSVRNLIEARSLLGLAGICVLSIGTVAGFGLVSWFRVPLSPTTTNVLPFIALGIGLDDMFVIVSAIITADSPSIRSTAEQLPSTSLDESDSNRTSAHQRQTKEAMSAIMGKVGPSVVLTSVALAVGFLVSSLVRIPAVYTFAYQLSATVIINLFLLFTLFVPLCAYDYRRILDGMILCVPCGRGRPAAQPASVGGGDEDVVEDKAATLTGVLTRFASSTLGPRILLRSRLTSILWVVGALAFTTAMLVVTIVKMSSGLPLNTVALSGTYQRDFLELQERAFPVYSSYLVQVSRTMDGGAMSQPDTQEALVRQANAIQESYKVSPFPRISDTSWFFNSSASLLGVYNRLEENENLNSPIAKEEDYRAAFGTFVTSNGVGFLGDLRCVERGNASRSIPCDLFGAYPGEIARDVELVASRIPFVHSGLVDTQDDFVRAISETREAVASVTLAEEFVETFVYGFIFEFWEQYIGIFRSLARVVGYAAIGIAVVVFLILRSLRLTLVILVFIGAIVVQVLGISTALGIQLNAVSVTTYVIVIAMSVEFTAHYAHAYNEADPDDVRPSECGKEAGQEGSCDATWATIPRVVRAQRALNAMLAPSTNGFLSTLFSLIVLAGSRFPFVRLYYWAAWSIVITVSYVNGMFLLPSLLALIGPNPTRSSGGETTTSAANESS